MKAKWMFSLMMAAALGLALAPAGAASAAGSGTVAQHRKPARPGAAVKAQSRMEAGRQLKAIEEKAELISAGDRMVVEDRLEAAMQPVELEVRTNEAGVASRLAAQFGVSVDALEAERAELGATWSELLIAHTLQANSHTAATASQLYKIHDEGFGWSQIAYGLGLDMKQFVVSVEAECRAAAGRTHDDKISDGEGNG